MEFKVIKLDRKRNNVVLSRRAVVEASMGEERAKLMETPEGRRRGQRRGQEHHRIRCVRRPRRHRRPAAHHRHGLARVSATRPKWCRPARKSPPRSSSSTPRRTASALGLKQMGDDPGWASTAATRKARACSARSPTSPTTARSSNSSPASKAWCTSPKWTGPTRTSPQQDRVAGRRGRSHGLEIDEDKRRISLGMKQCRANPGRNSRRTPSAATASRARSSRSPTSACSSAWLPASTAWCTCPTCPGTSPAKPPCATTRRARKSEAIVLAVDVDRERISLGIKQLDGDPFTTFVSVQRQGFQTVTGQGQDRGRRAPRSTWATTSWATCAPRNLPRPRGRCQQRAQGRRRSVGRGGQRRPQDAQHPAVDQGQGHGADEQGAMANLSQQSSRENAGTTSLGALLRASWTTTGLQRQRPWTNAGGTPPARVPDFPHDPIRPRRRTGRPFQPADAPGCRIRRQDHS